MMCVGMHRLTRRIRISAAAVLHFYGGMKYRKCSRFHLGLGRRIGDGRRGGVGVSLATIGSFFREIRARTFTRGVRRTIGLLAGTSSVVFMNIKGSSVVKGCKTECFGGMN